MRNMVSIEGVVRYPPVPYYEGKWRFPLRTAGCNKSNRWQLLRVVIDEQTAKTLEQGMEVGVVGKLFVVPLGHDRQNTTDENKRYLHWIEAEAVAPN